MYRYYNANSKKRRVDDCVIRAISVAENKTWDETYKKLSRLAQQQGRMIDDVNFVEDYLDKNYERIPHRSKQVGELTDEYPEGILLVTMDSHITVIIDGTIYDTWDCKNKTIRCVWGV